MHKEYLANIEEIIKDAFYGKMFILVDDENRENEGDLIIPAQMANAKAINFMAKHGRGLICLALTKERIKELGLPLMSQDNTSRHQTAFTVSIEAKEGVTTGISAADRAKTVAVAINPQMNAKHIASPGHVFPLQAREGGVLVRAGHTEAAVDIAKLAGLNPSAVICEIMNDDGTMARMPDLIKFAKEHELKIATIADLIAYRRRTEKLVKKSQTTTIKTAFAGEFELSIYINKLEYAEHLVLIKGKPDFHKPVMVRMHALNILNDVLGDTFEGKNNELKKSMQMIDKNGTGVIVLIREPHKNKISQIINERSKEHDYNDGYLKDYGIGAQILLDIGIKEIILLTNSKRSIIGIEGYGLKITKCLAIK